MHLDQDRLKTWLLLGATVCFATLGQLYLFYRREYVWDGVIFITIALICFVLLIRARRPLVARPFLTRLDRLRQRGMDTRLLVIGLACALNFIAARSANTLPSPNDYTLSVLLWLVSLLLPCIVLIPFSDLLRNIQSTVRSAHHLIRTNNHYITEWALVLGLILTGFLLRLWDLEHIPANLSGDEGTQGIWAVNVLRGQVRNPFATGWFTVPTMFFFALAGSLRLFGDSVAGLRTLPALLGSATLVFTYLLARRSLGRRIALFALAALTFNHFHVHFSRLAMNNITDPFFAALVLWLLTEGLRRSPAQGSLPQHKATSLSLRPASALPNSLPWFLSAGLALGLSWYGYFGSRVILLIVALYLALQSLIDRAFLRRHARSLALMALMALLAASPLLLHYANFPHNFTARFNQVSFFRWLDNELARPDHDPTLTLVLRQIWRSLSAFNHTLDPTFWYRAQIPLLDFVSGILFLFGLVVALFQWRRPAVRLILLWFSLALTLGWVLTENPPSSMRMVTIAPAVAILVALGLQRLLTLARWAIGGRPTHWHWAAAALLTCAALLNMHYYFVVYTPTRVYGNPNAETATILARYLRDGSTDESYPFIPQKSWDTTPFIYFYGPPFMYFDFGSIQFIARDVPGKSVPPKDQEPDFQIQVAGPTLFVLLRERLDELGAIQERFPNGHLDEFFSRVNGRLMFVVYEVLQ